MVSSLKRKCTITTTFDEERRLEATICLEKWSCSDNMQMSLPNGGGSLGAVLQYDGRRNSLQSNLLMGMPPARWGPLSSVEGQSRHQSAEIECLLTLTPQCLTRH